jgi:hypothetical protein
VSYWQGQGTFVDGLAQETCRDFVHTGYGLANIAHVAETTRIQGNDLWPSLATRMAATFEFHSTYELGAALPSILAALDRLNAGRGDAGHPACACCAACLETVAGNLSCGTVRRA